MRTVLFWVSVGILIYWGIGGRVTLREPAQPVTLPYWAGDRPATFVTAAKASGTLVARRPRYGMGRLVSMRILLISDGDASGSTLLINATKPAVTGPVAGRARKGLYPGRLVKGVGGQSEDLGFRGDLMRRPDIVDGEVGIA